MPHIVLDLQCCQSGSRLGGIGRYSIELAKAMILNAPASFDFTVLLNDHAEQTVAELRRELSDFVPQSAIRVFSVPQGAAYSRGRGEATVAAEIIREDFLQRLKPDFVHVASLFEGLHDGVVTSVSEYSLKSPVGVTLYDLIPYAQPDLYLTDRVARSHYLDKFKRLDNASLLLGISQYSVDEGHNILKGYRGEFVNIRGGVDSRFRKVPELVSELQGVTDSLGIRPGFLLYTASFDQRKNHKNLISAFGSLPREIRGNRQLVIVGNGWPGIYEELRAHGRASGVADDELVFTGRITDEFLVTLYNSTDLFVFPSLWEGLGLPVLEAMACGAPVIASNTTSLQEALGWDEASFDPTSIESISKKISTALEDREFRSRLLKHGDEHHRLFTWENSACAALDAIEHVIRGRARPRDNASSKLFHGDAVTEQVRATELRLSERQLIDCARSTSMNEIELGEAAAWDESFSCPTKVGLVTTWNTRCGIASYSQALATTMKLRPVVFCPVANGARAQVPEGIEYVECWHLSGDRSLNQLRSAIIQRDVEDIIIQFNYGFFDFVALRELIDGLLGLKRRVYITLHSTTDPPSEYGLQLSDLASTLRGASLVQVHTHGDVERLRAIGVNSNVVIVPHFVHGTLEDSPTPRSPISPSKFTIASYGFFLPRKGLPELAGSLAILRARGCDARLLFVNADYGDAGGVSSALIQEVKSQVIADGLQDFVEFHTEYLTDDKSLELLRRADLIVFPYQASGESSSAAVRMGIASGRPVATTPLSIFANVQHVVSTLPGITPLSIADGIEEIATQLYSGGSEITKILRAADTWRRAHGVPAAAAFQDRAVRFMALTGRWRPLFVAPLAKLPRLQSEYVGGTLRSTNSSGAVMVHGPYLDLAEGRYRLIVLGEGIGESSTLGAIKITASAGASTLGRFELCATSGAALLDVEFDLPRCSQVEILIQNAPGTQLSVGGYSLLGTSKPF